MTARDPIATATLAQLYIGQGHEGKATRILTEVLRDDPFDGAALHLMSRLGDRHATVGLCVDARKLELSWQGASLELHAVLVCYAPGPGGVHAVTRVTSVRCREAFGHDARSRPGPRGSAVACLGRIAPGAGFVAHAVASPVSWAYR